MIAEKTRASNKKEIPIFRMSHLSIDMINPAFMPTTMRFAAENVKFGSDRHSPAGRFESLFPQQQSRIRADGFAYWAP